MLNFWFSHGYLRMLLLLVVDRKLLNRFKCHKTSSSQLVKFSRGVFSPPTVDLLSSFGAVTSPHKYSVGFSRGAPFPRGAQGTSRVSPEAAFFSVTVLGFEISGGGGTGTCRCHLQAGRIHRPLDPGGCPRRSQRRRGDGIQPRRPPVQPRWPWIWQTGLFPPLLLQYPPHHTLRPPWARHLSIPSCSRYALPFSSLSAVGRSLTRCVMRLGSFR